MTMVMKTLLPCAPLLGALLSCHSPAPPPAPSGFSLSRFRQAGETVIAEPAEQEAIYRTVLRFYRPGPGQSRWLERHWLAEVPGDSGGMMDVTLAQPLVVFLGPGRFCLRDAGQVCSEERGGVLRVSRPYRITPDVVRVIVRFEGVAGPYAPPETAFSGTNVFLLIRRGTGWEIHFHHPADEATRS